MYFLIVNKIFEFLFNFIENKKLENLMENLKQMRRERLKFEEWEFVEFVDLVVVFVKRREVKRSRWKVREEIGQV